MVALQRLAASCAVWFALLSLTGCSLYLDQDPGDEEPDPDDPPNEPDPASPLAMDEPGIYEMAVDATHLYWVDTGQFDQEANVRRMPLDGGPIDTLFSTSERIYGLAIVDGYVYAAHTGAGYAGEIYRIPATGGPSTTIATGFNPTSVTVDGDWVYYSEAVSPGGRILRVPASGGTPEVVVSDVDNPWDLVADDGTLFYSEMNRGRMMQVEPGGAPLELASGWIGTNWMTVDESFVYFSACPTSSCEVARLYRVPRGGGPFQELGGGPTTESKLAITDDHLQWGSHVIPKTGGQAETMPGDGYPIGVAATADAFYFADFFTGAIYRW